MIVLHVLAFFSAIVNIAGDIQISEDEYALLPPIFSIDDNCEGKEKVFCRLYLRVEPLDVDDPSKAWKIIEETKRSKRHYNHEYLYHAICINESDHKDYQKVAQIYSGKYQNEGLKVKIISSDCNNDQYKLNTFDVVSMVLVFLYPSFWLLLGIYHFMVDEKRNVNMTMFSWYYNLKKLSKSYQQDDKLKHIQAIRFYTTVLVIFCHTFCSFTGAYIANTNYLEDIPLNFFRHSLRTLLVFLVQSFFLISSWLLSYNTFTVFRYDKSINVFRYGFTTFLNRYLRIIPPLMVIIGIGRSGWVYNTFSGPVKAQYTHPEYQRCVNNWWITLLFLSNHYKQNEMCHFTTWYLSADTQLYVVSLVLLMIAVRLQKHRLLFLAGCFVTGVAIPSVVSYLYHLDVIFRITPEYSKISSFLSFEFEAVYSSTYANAATYMLGLIFGYMYFLGKNKIVFNSNGRVFFWWSFTLGLPFLVIVASNYEYDRVSSAILAGALKPTFALGIGIGIFGMSHQIGGFLKKLCEWKPAVFLGNFTYSTYVVHFGIVFSRTALTTSPIHLSDYVLITSFIQDTILSFVGGFLLYILIEMPFSQLQNMFVYKFSVKKYKSNNKIK